MPATPLRPGSHHLAGFQRRGGCRELRTYLVRPLEVPRRSSKGREHCHVGHDEAFDTLEDPSTGDPDRTNGAAIEEDDDDRSKLAAKKLRVTALREALPSDQARSQFLSASRREMYDSLGLFHAHVKSAISLMFGIITAVLAVVGFVIEKNSSPPVLTLVLNAAPVVLALIFPFSIVSILVIGRYYKLYVAALFYTARLHDEEGIGEHLWFDDVRSLRAAAKVHSPADDHELIQRRSYGWPHSWSLYALLIGFIGLASLLLAILLWLQL